jgi:hypothetical protein
MPIMAAALGRKVKPPRAHDRGARLRTHGLTRVTADGKLVKMAHAFGETVEAIP